MTSQTLKDIYNALVSRDIKVVLATFAKVCWLTPAMWEAAKADARPIWDKYKRNGELLQESTWEVAMQLREKFPAQLPSTYRYLLYKCLFRDLFWMNGKPLPEELEHTVRVLFPNPEGLSYVPWKPPAERGAGKKRKESTQPKSASRGKKPKSV